MVRPWGTGAPAGPQSGDRLSCPIDHGGRGLEGRMRCLPRLRPAVAHATPAPPAPAASGLIRLCQMNLGRALSRRTGMKRTRIPHAPSTPLPELAEFLAPFRVHFKRSE